MAKKETPISPATRIVLAEKETLIYTEIQLILDTLMRVLPDVAPASIQAIAAQSVLFPEYNNIRTHIRDLDRLLTHDLARVVTHPPLFALSLACALDLAGGLANTLSIGYARTSLGDYDAVFMTAFARALYLALDLAFALGLAAATITIRVYNLDPAQAVAHAITNIHTSALANIYIDTFNRTDHLPLQNTLDRAYARARIRALDLVLACPTSSQAADTSSQPSDDSNDECQIPPISPPVGLPPLFLQRLRTTLAQSLYFENDAVLRSLFVDDRIAQWRHRISDNTAYLHRRIDCLIYNLHEMYDSKRNNALALFLQVLADYTEDSYSLQNEIHALIKELGAPIGRVKYAGE